MIISLRKIITYLAIYYPAIYTILYMISDEYGRLLAQIMLILCFGGMIQSKKKKTYLSLIYILIICLINVMLHGIQYMFNLDFYGFILLLLIISLYLNDNYLNELESKLVNEKVIKTSIFIYYIIIVISIFMDNGLRIESAWGVSIPMLYGPFELPHSLAYNQIIIFCMASILFRKTSKKLYLIIEAISFICIIWTGVRTVTLVIIIMLAYDLLKLKKVKIKYYIFSLLGLFFVFALLFSDIVINNPVVQKTLNALSKGNISNSRDDFNSYLLNFFCNRLSLSEKILGIGLPNLRSYMFLRYGTELHAHNDIFNVLIGMGLITFMYYARKIWLFCKKAGKILPIFIVIFLLSFFNGLYMYIGFTPSIAILIIYYKTVCLPKEARGNVEL